MAGPKALSIVLLAVAAALLVVAAYFALTDPPPAGGFSQGCDVAVVEAFGSEDEYGFRDEACVDVARDRMVWSAALLIGAVGVLVAARAAARREQDTPAS